MKLFVANLPYTATEDDILQVFAEQGVQISEVKIIHDRDTGQSKGFAFADLSDPTRAADVIALMNKMPCGGRPMVVAPANERKR